MADLASKLPVKFETSTPARASRAREMFPFASLRTDIDRLFDDFDRGWFAPWPGRSLFNMEALFPRGIVGEATPAVDIVENEKSFEITAEMPGIDEKDIELKMSNGTLTIKGEKKEEKEEKGEGYYLSERRFGSFQRCFQVPDGVDASKIDASFKNGVLKVVLPKTAEAKLAERKIPIKAA